MKPILQRAKAILGAKLVKTFQDACGEDQAALEEILNEAIRALSVVRQDSEWTGLMVLGEQD
jgi:hypothetical protein